MPDGRSCEDGDLCNGEETCQDGVCRDGTSPSSDDNNACTQDFCDPSTGVQHVPLPDGADCGDGDFCNGAETCIAGVCVDDTPLSCDDDNPCTSDYCEPTTGCHHGITACSDGNACTVGSCDPELGCVFSTINCDDNDACTVDTCDPASGCWHDALGCDDGDLCTTDTCDASTGCYHAAKLCSDGNACTLDTCDPQTGQCAFPPKVDELCNDGELCTVDDRCDAGGFCVGTVVNTDDDNPCTVDACDSSAGVTHEPADAGTPCSVGDAVGLCDGVGACVTLPASESVVGRV
ncbi:MAG: hypothetical protein ACOC1F_08720, partial [Myxococcota bacterium]